MNETLVPGGGTLESTELFAFHFRVVASMNVLWREVLFLSSSSSVICQTTGPEPLPKWFLHIVRSRASSSVTVFGKRLSRKSDNVVVFPFAFHIAVQQPFKPLWSRLLLYELKPSRASFALCFKSLLMTLLLGSVLISLCLTPTLWPVQQGRPCQ